MTLPRPAAQLDLFMDRARVLRDDGMARAQAHADAVVQNWSDRAFAYLCEFARTNRTLTAEAVRRHAEASGLPRPPDRRAWGGIIGRGAKAGIIRKGGETVAQDPRVHMNPIRVWISLL